MDARLEDGKGGADRDRIPARLQILAAQLRKVILQHPPAGPGAQES